MRRLFILLGLIVLCAFGVGSANALGTNDNEPSQTATTSPCRIGHTCENPWCKEHGYGTDDCRDEETTTTTPRETTTVTVTVPAVTVTNTVITPAPPARTITVTTPAPPAVTVTTQSPPKTVTKTVVKWRTRVVFKHGKCKCDSNSRLWHGTCHPIARGKG